MKKNNFKKIFVVFSLCVFLLSIFSISSFALNIDDVISGDLYQIKSAVATDGLKPDFDINVSGYIVDKNSGVLTSFSSLKCKGKSLNLVYYVSLSASTNDGLVEIVSNPSGSSFDVVIDFANNTMTKSEFESILSQYWVYAVKTLDPVDSMFGKANIALVGGTNSEGVAYDGLLGMVSKFGKFLVSTPLLLVLCIALPLVSFSVGLIIRIKNRA